MKVKFKRKTAMAVALLLIAMAAFLLPSTISGVQWAKVQALDCYEEESCTAFENLTCNDDDCDGVFMGIQVIGAAGRRFKQSVSEPDGHHGWTEDTVVTCYQTRGCIRSQTIPCAEDDSYMKIVDNGAVGFVTVTTHAILEPLFSCSVWP